MGLFNEDDFLNVMPQEPLNKIHTDSNPTTPSWFRILITNWLIADPDYIIFNDSRSYKNYQVNNHEGLKYIYLFGGRLRTVKQAPINVVAGFLIILEGVLFWIFEAKWVWYNISPAVTVIFSYIWFISASMFIKASTSDPGILPRNIHLPVDNRTVQDPQGSQDPQPQTTAPPEYFNTITVPYYQQLHHGVNVKYCPTCHIWRPPRTSHCGTCNVCVVNHDHHCIYLNNCIGFRNYQYFLWSLLSSLIALIIIIITSFIQIFHYKISAQDDISSFNESISTFPASFLLAILSIILLIYPFCLLLLHLCLTSWNLTTREYLNNVRPDNSFVNLFDHGRLSSLYMLWIGRPRGRTYYRMTDGYDKDDIRSQYVAKLS